MYIERLFITASNWKLPKCPAKIEKKNKLYIFTQWNTILPWRIKISNCSQQYEKPHKCNIEQKKQTQRI